ncbi:MAG: hypothetical protein IJA75_03075 [Oscillospiraceae bacterium]|nr:hypothetical protein [Oscillospiraceae bacterium]
MGKSRVKGIVVEIGGDTTGLDKALSGTNGRIYETQTKLKDVERLLKLDPKNTKLLEQRQRYLAEAVQKTEEKLRALNDANDQVRDGAKNWDAFSEAFAPIQKDIADVTEELKRLEKEKEKLEKRGRTDKSLLKEIEVTRAELETLNECAEECREEFGRPIPPDQYDALQREIIETELKLKDLRDSAHKAEGSLDDIEGEAKDVADAMDKAADRTSVFGDVLKAEAIVEGAKGIVNGLRDIAEETKEYRRIMGSLDVSSEAAGYSAEQTETAYKKLYGVLADEQSAATTVANLQALKLPQEQLLSLIDKTVGAWAKYGDSIPIDGLAEAINETVKTGRVTGVLADILNWGAEVGSAYEVQLKDITALEMEYAALTADGADAQAEYIALLKKKMLACESVADLIPLQKAYDAAVAGSTSVTEAYIEQLKAQIDAGKAWNSSVEEATAAEDKFNLSLEQCSTETERLDLIMQAFNDQNLSAMAEKWRENNASMVKANETEADLQAQLAVLGETIEPIATMLVEMTVKALEWFNGLDAGAQHFLLSTVAIIAALGPVGLAVSSVSGVIGKLTGGDLPGLSAALGKISGVALPGLQTAFSSVFGFIAANPIVLLIGAVVGLVALVVGKGDEIIGCLDEVDDFLQNVFATDWTEVFGPVLGGGLNDFFDLVEGIWNGIKSILEGVINFIQGVFTGNWEQAWLGVRQIFAGIFEGLAGLLKAPINAVIQMVNAAISGINWLIEGVNKIPGVDIGTIGKIPLLANGGEVIRGNAIVGDGGPELLTVTQDKTVVQPLNQTTNHRTTQLGGVHMTIYGAPGQDVRELAELVMEEMQSFVDSEEAAIG